VLLLLFSLAAPLLVMAAVSLSCRTGSPPTGSVLHRTSGLPGKGGWEGLSAEVARIERRRALHRTGAASRRRHLAAVLPADPHR
jgi:hypothetical protein